MSNKQLIFPFFSSVLISCAPISKLHELQTIVKEQKKEINSLELSNNIRWTELNDLLRVTKSEKEVLCLDTNLLNSKISELEEAFNFEHKKYIELEFLYKKLLAGNEQDYDNYSKTIKLAQDDILDKQDKIRMLSLLIDEKRKLLNSITLRLKGREERVVELENVVRQKDSTLSHLKYEIMQSFKNIHTQGIGVDIKEGKIYLRLDDTLLFESGKYKIQESGIKVLNKICTMLEENLSINIVVEGHTDNVPYHGHGEIKDNWDLSVIRASAVTKMLLKNGKINGSRITSAGRGEFDPIVNINAVNKEKNRRIEIILIPKWNEVLDILNKY